MQSDKPNRIYLHAGDLCVTENHVELSTVLGSCVAVCLWDPRRGLGGMNHYLGTMSLARDSRGNRCGEVAIKNLLKGVYRLGAKRQDLKCGVFGGAKVIDLSCDIGVENVRVAREAFEAEGIHVCKWDVGGDYGRRLLFNTHTGETVVRNVSVVRDCSAEENRATVNATGRGGECSVLC